MTRKSLSNVDRAWLRMDNPTNLMVITGIMTFDTPLDIDRFKATIEHSLLRFKRFRQRIVLPWLPWMRPTWQYDPDFDLETHIQRVTLPAPGGKEALQELISILMSTNLDFSRPLWHFYVVEEYGEGSAVVFRLHHCIADGITLMQVLLSMAETSPDTPLPSDDLPDLTERARTRRRYRAPLSPLRNSIHTTRKIIHKGKEILTDPSLAYKYTKMGFNFTTSFGRLVLRWPDPITTLKGPLGIEKRAVWSEPFSLDDVKFTGKKLGGTVNDILLTAVAGGLRRYLLSKGESVDRLSIRGIVPVNLRPIELDEDLGNQFGLVFLSLPIYIEDPIDRLHALKRHMDGIKGSMEAVAAFSILYGMGAMPSRVQDIIVDIFDTKGTAVTTNVPGPQEQLYFAGAPLNTIMGWVPVSGRLGVGVSIISYNGKVWFGVSSDEGLVPDPELVVELSLVEFEAMKALAEKDVREEPETEQPILLSLSEALQKLDALLDEVESTSMTQTEETTSDQCQGMTKSGRQCKNRPAEGSAYCRLHEAQMN
jgi:WS/DGAT/MGAT family acyltransferase